MRATTDPQTPAQRRSSRGVVLALLALLPLCAFIGQELDNSWFALSLYAGTSWILIAFATAPTPAARWSPMRLFVPAFALYTACSLSLSVTTTKPTEILCNALAITGFSLGYFIAIPTARRKTAAELTCNTRPRVGLLYSLFFSAVFVYGYLVAANGSAPAFASDTNLARTTFFPNGVYSTIVVVSLQVCLMAVAAGVLSSSRWARRPGMLLILFGSAVVLYTLGNRGMLALPLLMIAIFFLWNRRVNLPIVLIAIVAAISIFSYSGFQRNLQSWGFTYLNDLALTGYGTETRVLAPLLSYLAGTSETFSRTISLIPDHVPFQYGLQFFGPLFLQPSADLFIKEAAGLNFTGFGLAIGFTNAFYIDWGVIGCFVGPLLFATFVALFYRKLDDETLPGRGLLAYISASLLLTLYGHPFAYLSYLLIPTALFYALGGRASTFFSSAEDQPRARAHPALKAR